MPIVAVEESGSKVSSVYLSNTRSRNVLVKTMVLFRGIGCNAGGFHEEKGTTDVLTCPPQMAQ